MASKKQIEANQHNAQRSTGPVTPEGKAVASQNALKHGLRAGRVLFATDEVLQEIRDGLAAEWQPQTLTEWTILEQLAIAFHHQACFQELEAEWESRINAHHFTPALQIIWRRLASLERSIHKTVDTLTKIRKSRAAERKLAESKSAATEPVQAVSQPEPPPAPRPSATPDPRTLVMRERSHPPAEPLARTRSNQPAGRHPRTASVSALIDLIGDDNFPALAMAGQSPHPGACRTTQVKYERTKPIFRRCEWGVAEAKMLKPVCIFSPV